MAKTKKITLPFNPDLGSNSIFAAFGVGEKEGKEFLEKSVDYIAVRQREFLEAYDVKVDSLIGDKAKSLSGALELLGKTQQIHDKAFQLLEAEGIVPPGKLDLLKGLIELNPEIPQVLVAFSFGDDTTEEILMKATKQYVDEIKKKKTAAMAEEASEHIYGVPIRGLMISKDGVRTIDGTKPEIMEFVNMLRTLRDSIKK